MNKSTFKIERVIEDEEGEYQLLFTNGKRLTYYHFQECCEYVYAAFNEIEEMAYDYEFVEPLLFENVAGYGFRFGNTGKMVSVPCYDKQEGYYSDDLTIKYDGETVLEDCGKEHQYYY